MLLNCELMSGFFEWSFLQFFPARILEVENRKGVK
jgi:hypothetical protein